MCQVPSLKKQNIPSLRLTRLDEGGIDGDLCGLLHGPAGGNPSCAALVWPTAEKLPLIRKLTEVSWPSSNLFVLSFSES